MYMYNYRYYDFKNDMQCRLDVILYCMTIDIIILTNICENYGRNLI